MTIDSEVEARILTFMSGNLHIILEDEGDQSEIPRSKFAKDLAAQLTNLIAQEANKARIDELSNVRLDYGPYRAETFVDGKQTSLLDRIAQLTADKEQNNG